MGIFRKRETYNEQMLREAGLDRVRFNEPTPQPTEPTPRTVGDASFLARHGTIGPRDWDATTATTAPGISGDQVRFTVLPNGDMIVSEESGAGDLSPLADAIEGWLDPPYKAVASRQDGDVWGVGGKRIEVATIPYPGGETLELSQNDGETEFRVDGGVTDTVFPVELRRLGDAFGPEYCVQASRIDGDSWEVKVSPL